LSSLPTLTMFQGSGSPNDGSNTQSGQTPAQGAGETTGSRQ
jgi:hypothetical protein